jgi:hypothetical protein
MLRVSPLIEYLKIRETIGSGLAFNRKFKPAMCLSPQHERSIDTNARQPCRESRPSIKTVQVSESLHGRFLENVFSIVPILRYLQDRMKNAA